MPSNAQSTVASGIDKNRPSLDVLVSTIEWLLSQPTPDTEEEKWRTWRRVKKAKRPEVPA